MKRFADYLSLQLLRQIGIRRRLLLAFLLLALLPLLVSGTIWYQDSTAAIAERTRVLSTEVVKQVAKNVGVEMARLESDSEALVLSSPIQEGLSAYQGGDETAMTQARRDLMRVLLDRYGSFGFVSQKYLLDRDNRIIDTQVFTSLGRGVVQFVERAPKLLGRPWWSTLTNSSGQTSMVLLRAIHSKSNNRLIGHLFLGLRPAHFAAIFEDVDLGQHTEVAVVDADSGKVLVNSVEKIGGEPTPAPPRALTEELRRSIASNQRSGFFGHDAQLTAYARIADTSWFVVGSIAQSRLTTEARVMLETSVLIGLAGLFGCVLLAMLLARSIAKPLDDLVDSMRASAQGAHVRPVEPQGSDELTTLAQHFNTMAGTLMRNQEQLEERVDERTRDLAAANEQLAALSMTDAMTGIANRRRFDEALERELQRASRAGTPLALLMIDVDFFKKYNDHYGHQQGDACLRSVAMLLQSHARRAGDLAARYGGEEFTLIAADTDPAAANALAETIRAGVEALRLPHVDSPMGVLTASVGVVALVPTSTTSAAQILGLADQAMYRAKDQGRNQAVMSQLRLRA
ncbi:MAG: diguanylate cyclase domain-containing protein [Massilia sp.]